MKARCRRRRSLKRSPSTRSTPTRSTRSTPEHHGPATAGCGTVGRAAAVPRTSYAGDKNMALVEVKVPDIGDFKDVEVIELLVRPGDRIKAEQSLVTVESDKASMEIPSSAAGVVTEMRIKIGDKVSEGS